LPQDVSDNLLIPRLPHISFNYQEIFSAQQSNQTFLPETPLALTLASSHSTNEHPLTQSPNGYTKTRIDCVASDGRKDGRGSYVSSFLQTSLSPNTDCVFPNSTTKNPDDVVITMAIRTPLTKGKKGGMKDTPLDFIVYSLLKEVRERMNMDPAIVEDICLGNVRSR
jgi:hypothetical protein